uniref:Uncharacterized protein n=1 Tax=Anguilla anguilla TaxID=7936 RepID=A0A0E9SAS5_ANGAN
MVKSAVRPRMSDPAHTKHQ